MAEEQKKRQLKQHIFLIGFMGTGKSTVSRKLRDLLQVREIDMDQMIVSEAGMSIPAMFEKFGESCFREKETQMLRILSARTQALISCGGGTVLRPENVAIMKSCGQIVLLTAEPETVFQRVRYGKNRPVLNGHMNVAYIAQLMEQRRAAYESACDVRVSTDDKTPAAIAQEILELIRKKGV